MYYNHTTVESDLILSVLRYVFHSDCTLEEIYKTSPSILQTIIDDISYLSDIPIKALSGEEFIEPSTNIIKVLKLIQTTFMHYPEDISRCVYTKLNDKLTEIIKKSTIEYDISMAYLLKSIIKEILLNGVRRTDNTTYRYTWKDRLETFYYLCGQLRFIEAATMRSNNYTHQSVDLISSLNHARQLTKRQPLMDIIRDSLY